MAGGLTKPLVFEIMYMSIISITLSLIYAKK